MPLRAASRQLSLTSQVTEQLRAQITSGEWHVGARIPTEAELADALGVSRNTIREAVRALMHVGVLERRQGSGTYVTSRSELAGLVAKRVAGGALSETIEVRHAIDVAAARLAARRHTDADLARLDAALARLEAAWDSGEVATFVDADADFHTAVVRCTRNSLLCDLYIDVGAALRIAIAATVGDALVPDRRRDHAPLVEAIRRGDEDSAATIAASLIEP
jgi:DNA-binding FadR family transcriptional regulator